MAINPEVFIHESDRAALQALKAIPGFTQLMQAFMKIWNERQYKITNMSSYMKISDSQMKKYYDMLPPICEKLGIDIPELYVMLDPRANAFTSGDNNPFIVMTSGLLENVPEELIPTVLAHECGHIACHHVLYATMGRLILGGAISLLGLGNLITMPIQMAFAYWMRCSEYSADRAAVVCDGTANKMVDLCMCFAGATKDINAQPDRVAFMNQAIEYREMMNTSMWNKTLEFMMHNHIDHPLSAVRAYEANAWATSEDFAKIHTYMIEDKAGNGYSVVPLSRSADYYKGRNYQDVVAEFKAMGFTDVIAVRDTEKKMLVRDGQVVGVTIGDKTDSKQWDWCDLGAKVVITYYEGETEEEIKASHPGQAKTPNSSTYYVGKPYMDVHVELSAAGFTNIFYDELKEKKSWLIKDKSVSMIYMNHNDKFEKNEWYDADVPITIVYHSFVE